MASRPAGYAYSLCLAIRSVYASDASWSTLVFCTVQAPAFRNRCEGYPISSLRCFSSFLPPDSFPGQFLLLSFFPFYAFVPFPFFLSLNAATTEARECSKLTLQLRLTRCREARDTNKLARATVAENSFKKSNANGKEATLMSFRQWGQCGAYLLGVYGHGAE